MTKILISIAAAGLIGGGAYLYTTTERTPSSGDTEESQSTSEETASTFAGIIGAGYDVTCEVAHEENGTRTEGRVYVADQGEKIRGSFTISGSVNGTLELLRSDRTNYLWGSAMPQGIKVAVTDTNKDTLFAHDTDTAIPENVTFTCSKWGASASAFTVPSDIEFMDMSAQLEGFTAPLPQGDIVVTPTTDLKATQCALCDQTGASKAECRRALKCDE